MIRWLRDKAGQLLEGRSPRWPAVRDRWLKIEPGCQVCGVRSGCEVHHLQPYRSHPELELDEGNLITLCRPHHLLFGHLMNWRSINVSCVRDSQNWREKIAGRPHG